MFVVTTMTSERSPHSVLSDVRDALAAPKGDAGVDARMLALDSVQGLMEQLEAAQGAARYWEIRVKENAALLETYADRADEARRALTASGVRPDLRDDLISLRASYEALASNPATDSGQSLREQLGAARRDADQLGEQADLQGAENQRLLEQLEALERALRAIAFNAESFHKGEDGKERALKVILAWATDPKLVPEGVGYPAKIPAFENREELPLVDVEPVDPSPATRSDEPPAA